MSGKVNLHVGSIDEMGKRFVSAWHRLEQGKQVDETHLTFFNLEAMLSTLSPKRLSLLRQVHWQPISTIAELAKIWGRDYKRVHEAVTSLVGAGLLERYKDGIRTPYDKVQAIVSPDG